MIEDLVLSAVCLSLLAASAFFSGSETALFALDSSQRHILRKRSDLRARHAAMLLRDMNAVLITVLVGNTVVNIFLAVLATRVFIRHLGTVRGPLLSGILVTAIILIFGEILPKSLAVHHSLSVSLRVSPWLFRVKEFLAPLTRFFRRLSHAMIQNLDRVLPGDDLGLQQEDMHALLSLAGEEGSIGRKERELVRGAFELGNTPVAEVMTPRVQLFLLEAKTPAGEAARRLRAAGYSLAPVYDGSPDHVLGLLTALDLLGQEQGPRTAGELARPAHFCPESQRAGSLLRELLDEQAGAAVVLDEYGALAGLATLEDLYELLVGDILKQKELEKDRFYLPDEETLIASSRMAISHVKELLGVQLESDSMESLGGYLMEALGELPAVGHPYRIGPLVWTVLSAEGPVLGTLRLERRA